MTNAIRPLEIDEKRNYAIRLIRALCPEVVWGEGEDTIHLEKCLELMLKFAEMESARADNYRKIAESLLANSLPAPILLPLRSEAEQGMIDAVEYNRAFGVYQNSLPK